MIETLTSGCSHAGAFTKRSVYRGTSLIRNCLLKGPYSRPTPRADSCVRSASNRSHCFCQSPTHTRENRLRAFRARESERERGTLGPAPAPPPAQRRERRGRQQVTSPRSPRPTLPRTGPAASAGSPDPGVPSSYETAPPQDPTVAYASGHMVFLVGGGGFL